MTYCNDHVTMEKLIVNNVIETQANHWLSHISMKTVDQINSTHIKTCICQGGDI